MNTPDDWWTVLDESWPELLKTAVLCGAPLNDVWNETSENILLDVAAGETLLVKLARAKRDQDWRFLHHFLQRCWEAAPDKPYIHTWPAWGDLCDLCSDAPSIFEPEEAAKEA